MGERIAKIVKPDASDPDTWSWTYYVRDAQGNVMAVYDRKTFNPSTSTEPPNLESIDINWSQATSMEYLKLSEQHLYGSSRLGLLQRDLYLSLYSEEFGVTITNLPPWYSPFEPLPSDPCGCDEETCEAPPCEPCWCVEPDPCGCPPCVGEGCEECYCSEWPPIEEDAPHAIGYFERGRKR